MKSKSPVHRCRVLTKQHDEAVAKFYELREDIDWKYSGRTYDDPRAREVAPSTTPELTALANRAAKLAKAMKRIGCAPRGGLSQDEKKRRLARAARRRAHGTYSF